MHSKPPLAPTTSEWRAALRSELALSLYSLLGFVVLCVILFLTPVSRFLFDNSDSRSAGESGTPSILSDPAKTYGTFTLPRTRASLGDGSGHIILGVTLEYSRQAVWELSERSAGDTRLQHLFMLQRQDHMQGVVVNQLGYHTMKSLSEPQGLEVLSSDVEDGINKLYHRNGFINRVLLKDFLLFPLPVEYQSGPAPGISRLVIERYPLSMPWTQPYSLTQSISPQGLLNTSHALPL